MDFYSTVEKARKNGKIDKGVNEVTKALERNTAKMVILAKDTSPVEIIQHLPVLCKEKGIQCEEVDSRQKLGIAAGINVPCSAVAIIESGDGEIKKEKKKKAE